MNRSVRGLFLVIVGSSLVLSASGCGGAVRVAARTIGKKLHTRVSPTRVVPTNPRRAYAFPDAGKSQPLHWKPIEQPFEMTSPRAARPHLTPAGAVDQLTRESSRGLGRAFSPTQIVKPIRPVLLIPKSSEEFQLAMRRPITRAEEVDYSRIRSAFATKFGPEGRVISSRAEWLRAVAEAHRKGESLLLIGHSEQAAGGSADRLLVMVNRGERELVSEAGLLHDAMEHGVQPFILTCHGQDIAVKADIRYTDMIAMAERARHAAQAGRVTATDVREEMRMALAERKGDRVMLATAGALVTTGIAGNAIYRWESNEKPEPLPRRNPRQIRGTPRATS